MVRQVIDSRMVVMVCFDGCCGVVVWMSLIVFLIYSFFGGELCDFQ